jgi:large conductance mechanosensitive channel
MLKGFRDFLMRGNVVDLAVAVVIGAAFTAVVTSFADSFLTPLIGLLGGGGELGGEWVINDQHFTWGAFVSSVITFVITAAVVYFLVVMPYTKAKERLFPAEEEGMPADVALLEQIRDLLQAQNNRSV